MSDHGVIIEWSEGWGTIRLGTGAVLRFNQNACGKGVVCAVGAEIWVAQHVPYVGGQRRATSVQATPDATLTPYDLLKKKSELDNALTERLIRELGRGFDSAPHERVPHVDRQLALLDIHVDTTILADDAHEPLGVVYQPEQLAAWCPFDPCFVAFAGIDGDAWGFLCYPPLLSRGEAPIVHWDHEGSPMAFEAPTFGHWLVKRSTSAKRKAWLAARGFLVPEPVSTTTLSKTVRAIVAGTPPDATVDQLAERAAAAAYATSTEDERLARLDALLACCRTLRWPDVLIHRAEVQRQVLVAKQAYDAAVARITREHHLAHTDIYTAD